MGKLSSRRNASTARQRPVLILFDVRIASLKAAADVEAATAKTAAATAPQQMDCQEIAQAAQAQASTLPPAQATPNPVITQEREAELRAQYQREFEDKMDIEVELSRKELEKQAEKFNQELAWKEELLLSRTKIQEQLIATQDAVNRASKEYEMTIDVTKFPVPKPEIPKPEHGEVYEALAKTLK
jgi:hypothetical protein